MCNVRRSVFVGGVAVGVESVHVDCEYGLISLYKGASSSLGVKICACLLSLKPELELEFCFIDVEL